MASTKSSSESPRASGRIAGVAIPLGLIMLAVWALATFAFSGPGWMHLFLTLGVFFVIWGIVARASPRPRAGATRR
jgi:hypothetical protein